MKRIAAIAAILVLARQARATDFTAGNINGAILWNGANVSGNEVTTIYVYVPGPGAGTYIGSNGAFAFPAIQPGTYTLGVYGNGCPGSDPYRIGSATTTVDPGQTVSVPIDVTATAGRVRGAITVNGAPVSSPNISIPGLCGSWRTNGDGTFLHYLPPGSYTASVGGSGGTIGSLSFTVTAGQTTDLGTVNFETGNVAGHVLFGGAPISDNELTTIYVYIPGVTGNYIGSDGGFSFQGVAPGAYTIGVYGNGCPGSDAYRIGSESITVAGGATTQADIDVTPTAGLVKGFITVNGAPLSGPGISVPGLCGSWRSGGDGSFRHLLPPGNYTASVSGTGGYLGNLSFTITAGQTTDLGTVNFQVGDVTGAVVWNGAPVSGQSVTTIYVYVPGVTGNYIDSSGNFGFHGMLPGAYSFNAYGNGCPGSDAYLLGQRTIDVAGGVTTNGNIDITQTAGRVTGIITVNGVPLPNPNISVPGLCGSWRSSGDGTFAHMLRPGSYTADVSGPSGLLGAFNFVIGAGQTTGLDVGSTSPGSDVKLDSGGGLTSTGGLEITFPNVTVGGTTTVVASGIGPDAPPGLRVVGVDGQPHYWDITSSATFDSLHLCVKYDASQVQGAEASLKLADVKANFKDITTGVDTDGKIVCGASPVASQFALIEPVLPTITPATATVLTGGQQQFGAGGGSGGYTWSVSGGSGGAVSASGLYTAGATGDTTDTVTVTDSAGQSASAVVTVKPAAPTLSIAVTPGVLWPPNGKLVEVQLAKTVSDPQARIDCSATSSEPASGIFAWSGGRLWLKAERNGNGSGRTYTVTCTATSQSGYASKPATATVLVPHDQR